MRIRAVGAVGTLALIAGLEAPSVCASVDLVLRPVPQTVALGNVVEVSLYAVSEEGTEFSAMDVILTWDAATLELLEIVNTSPHNWNFVYGLTPDSQLDGLNDSLLDGDAFFQAVSFNTATATAEGLLMTTMRFATLAETDPTEVVIEATRGGSSSTRVFQPGAVNVTGDLGRAGITIVVAPRLSVWDLFVPAGRLDAAVVSGEITGKPTYGVTILLEATPRLGNSGTVAFTESPPVDIAQLGDPWPAAGTFTPFDTDLSLSPSRNGSIDDNGTFVPAPVTFSGALSSFPLIASPDADGVWDLVLSTSSGNSNWGGLLTTLRHATLTVVMLGDGNGDEVIDIRDFSQFQLCFTGSDGFIDPLAPGLSCGVYDFNEDGVIDAIDYTTFFGVLSGPGP